MSFSENLKGELEYRGMPVKELAHKTGIPKQTIDKYLLSNGSMPPADKAVLIAGVLEVTVEYLVTGNRKPAGKTPGDFLSPEMRSIKNCVEPLSREKRKLIETSVLELTNMLRQPSKDEPLNFTLTQKIFLRLFRNK